MRIIAAILGAFILSGCGSFLNSVTKKTEITETRHDASKATAQGSVEISYPQAASYNVSASGNAVVNLVPDAGGLVRASKAEQKTASELSDQEFSMDELIKSVPEWAWPCIIFGLISLIGAYVFLTKTTAAGRALDAGLAGGMKALGKISASIASELESMAPDDPSYQRLRKLKDELKFHEAGILAKRKPKKTSEY